MAQTHESIAVLGLGYVGLPLATALARHFDVLGYDRDGARIEELKSGQDRTGETTAEALANTRLRFSADETDLGEASVIIVAVPTPVDGQQRPDLSLLTDATRTIGRYLHKGDLVVYESTVYPGVTDDICGPVLEEVSGLRCGEDFFLGYSPERVNPGDQVHTIERITKVIAGQTPAVVDRLRAIYGPVTGDNVFVARDIRTAEAAKVIENAQRDINIAFVNEVAMIARRLGLSSHDVLEAAGTKWNFLNFSPGLVGGHCIGVDPFYLAHRAIELGHDPEIILAGRRINDSMGRYLGREIAEQLEGPGDVLVLGLTFKENVPDLRNSRVIDLIEALQANGRRVVVHDSQADPAEAKALYGVELESDLEGKGRYAAVVGAVAHRQYRDLVAEDFQRLLAPDGLLVDIKGIWRSLELPDSLRRWTI